MTNARAYLVRHCRQSAVRCFAIGLLASPLAGCQSADLMGGGTSATSQPAMAAPATGRSKLAVAPIVGAPAAVADMLSGSVASSMQKQSIPISHSAADAPDFTVRGYLVATPDKAGTKLSYIWDITDKTGQRAKRFTGEEIVKGKKGKDPWAGVDQTVVDSIAAKTSTELAAWVPMKSGAAPNPPTAMNAPTTTQSSFGTSIGQIFGFGAADQTASAAPAPAATAPAQSASLAAPKPGSLITGTTAPSTMGAAQTQAPATTASLPPRGDASTTIPVVTGAPGDGAQSLTSALQRALSGNGVKLAASGVSGSYTVQGRVTMGQPAAGKQSIKIEWMVFDPAGKKVGTVSQNNVIPQGSLDGPWGKTADAAAAAAAQGVLKLLPHQTATN